MSGIPEGCPSIAEIQEFLDKRAANAKHPEITTLGRGAFGEVFRYKDWVIKILNLSDPMTKRTFEIESHILDKLTDIKELEGYIAPFCWSADSSVQQRGYIVMKYVKTITLHDLLDKYPRLTYKYGTSLLQNMMEGLRLLHAAGYLHRDLKPANILIRAGSGHSEELKTVPIMIDFGLACPFPCNEWWRVGTPDYFPGNWYSGLNVIPGEGPAGEKYTYRTKGFTRKGQFALSKVVGGPGPNWKAVKERPYALPPIYSQRTDAFSMHKVMKKIFNKIDWDGHEGDREAIREYIEKLRGYKVAALAAQVSQTEPPEVKERRLKALANLNRRREARMEDLDREEAEARMLVNFGAKVPTRKKARGASSGARSGERSGARSGERNASRSRQRSPRRAEGAPLRPNTRKRGRPGEPR
jgi:hypothetical protein